MAMLGRGQFAGRTLPVWAEIDAFQQAFAVVCADDGIGEGLPGRDQQSVKTNVRCGLGEHAADRLLTANIPEVHVTSFIDTGDRLTVIRQR